MIMVSSRLRDNEKIARRMGGSRNTKFYGADLSGLETSYRMRTKSACSDSFCPTSSMSHISDAEEEQIHFANVITTFQCYAKYSVSALSSPFHFIASDLFRNLAGCE
jgi:hypothetical protein